MKNKKANSAVILRDLIEYLTTCLEELTAIEDKSQFTEGEIIAFVECLEIVGGWKDYHKYGVENVEERFPIE